VSVPKESIWQELRSECLDAIPWDCRIDATNPVNLASWQKQGYYSIRSANRSRFELIASSADIGSALLTDVECLLDHAAEHQVTLWRQINSSEWLSPAWLGVTVYYWGFFISLAITRLTGKTAWFVTPEIARDLKKLSPVPSSTAGAGCFRIACANRLSATNRLVVLKKTKARFHDDVWGLWLSSCSSKVGRLPSPAVDSLERRLFTAIATTAKRMGNDWPSAFRNAINYRSGFAYTAVRRRSVLKSFSYLRQPSTYDMTDLLARFEKNVLIAKNRDWISKAPQVVLEVLVDLTFIMHALATELHAELIDRHGLDGRWLIKRRRFLQTNGLNSGGGTWPS
jgi:hypothetical protein